MAGSSESVFGAPCPGSSSERLEVSMTPTISHNASSDSNHNDNNSTYSNSSNNIRNNSNNINNSNSKNSNISRITHYNE